MPVAIPAILGLVASGYQMYQSDRNAKKAKSLAGQAQPNYDIPQGAYDNLALSQSLSSQGLDAYSRQDFLNNSNAGLSGAISGILRGGGDPNAISSAYGNYENGMNKLAVADANAKLRNIYGLMGERDKMNDSMDKQWQVNKYAPWANNHALAASLRKTSQDQQTGAITSAVGAAGSLAGGASQARTINNVGGWGGGGGNPGMGAPSMGGGMGFGKGLSSPDNPTYANLIGTGMGGRDYTNVYDPATNTYSSGIDWSRINPQSRQAIYKMLNQGYNGQ